MTSLSEEQAADAYCRYLAGYHYEDFSVASSFLPADIRLHLARLYTYCNRITPAPNGGPLAGRVREAGCTRPRR